MVWMFAMEGKSAFQWFNSSLVLFFESIANAYLAFVFSSPFMFLAQVERTNEKKRTEERKHKRSVNETQNSQGDAWFCREWNFIPALLLLIIALLCYSNIIESSYLSNLQPFPAKCVCSMWRPSQNVAWFLHKTLVKVIGVVEILYCSVYDEYLRYE